jgi:uncharacterized protein (DUF1800 family)
VPAHGRGCPLSCEGPPLPPHYQPLCRLVPRTVLLPLAGLMLWAVPAGAQTQPTRFYSVRPCRAVDTRLPASPLGGPVLAAGSTRTFTLVGTCNTSPTAKALAVNLTAVQPSAAGHFRLFPAGAPLPNASALSYAAGKARANNAIVAAGQSGGVSVYNGQISGTAHVLVDITGYFDDPANNQAPVVSAGFDQTIAHPASASLFGTASDDGRPGASLTYAWSKRSGPGTVTFTAPGALATGASFNVAGTYVLRLSVSDTQLTGTADVQVRVDPTQQDLLRFMDQASFGADQAQIARATAIGLSAWVDEQMALPASDYPALPMMPSTRPDTCTGTCSRDNYSMYLLQTRFFTNAFYGQDQLRQRVAWALHKLIVVSGRDGFLPSRYVPYLRIFNRNAFGNFRQILQEITLNPAMGAYLDMASSTRTRPNENYAREVLQIFSVGTDLLNPDGTPQIDALGEPLPTYDQSVVDGFTKVFTGWTYGPDPAPGIRNYFDPMVLRATNHDTGTKTLLRGFVVPAGQTGQQDLAMALDNIFNHPNVGPYIGTRLIRELVTSNPSPAYVARVTAVFDDNGNGVRGDLRAVVKAILFDPEARGPAMAAPDQGRLRDPIQFATGVLRAMGVRSADGLSTSDGHVAPQGVNMGLDLFRPTSVFSYYPAEFLVPGTTDLHGPEFGVISASTTLRRANFVNTMTYSRINTSTDAPRGTSINLAPLEALAANPTTLVNELDRRFMHGMMSIEMKNAVIQAVSAVAATNPRGRAQQGLYLVCSSSQYQVQR